MSVIETFDTPKRPLVWRLGRSPRAHQCAVIDIGSNSVRLIVYQLNGRSIVPRINEKVMAGLGKGLMQTGKLSETGVPSAMAALTRFSAICQSLGVTDIRAFATAAVREASDGPEFCRQVKEQTGINIRIFSGEDEARYAAMGVIAAQRTPTGLIGDLGGSSLELVKADAGILGEGKTYKLGPLALTGEKTVTAAKLRSQILSELRSQGKLPVCDTFYAVGGAWRAIAKTYMHFKDYPLHVLQSYKVPAVDMIAFCDLLTNSKKSDVQALAKRVAGKRFETLGLTAKVLKNVLLECKAQQLIISAYGVREGMVYAEMSEADQRLDPLFAGITSLARPDAGQAGFARALNDFLHRVVMQLEPVFEDPQQEERLIVSSFILADIGAIMHPDHRADIARQIVLRGPYTGVDHAGRIFLGLITGIRYDRRFEPTDLETANLTPEQIQRARVIAHLIRVAAEFSGRTERILRQGQLSIEGDELVLTVKERHRALMSEGVEKRMGHAASVMGLTPRLS